MAKAKKSSMKRGGNSVIRSAVRALQRSLSWSSRSTTGDLVKEGHFPVLAVHDDMEEKRFVVSLSCLSHPVFLRLLDMAEEEFGFTREGAIALPCRPSELERIIGELQARGGHDQYYS